MIRAILVCGLVLAVAVAAATPLAVGSKVPDLSLATENGKVLKLTPVFHKNAATLLYFWSFETGARPDDFVQLQAYVSSAFEGLGVVAICIDGSEVSARDWKQSVGCTFDFAVDKTDQRTTARLFGVRKCPALFVVNREGMITQRFDRMEDEHVRAALIGLGCEAREGQ
jgi:peroxiredoxin